MIVQLARRRVYRVIAAVIIVSAYALVSLGPLSAHNTLYVYTNQNTRFQYGTPPPRNWASVNFVLARENFYWVDPQLQQEAANAVAQWNSPGGIPQLRFVPQYPDGPIDYYISHAQCGGQECTGVTSFQPIQGVNMARTFSTTINSDVTGANGWAPGVRQSAIAHAMGHVYGLDDRYYMDNHCGPTPPNGPSTVMNGTWNSFFPPYNLFIPYVQLCDTGAYGPTSTDFQWAHDLYASGGVDSWQLDFINDIATYAIVSWRDVSQAETLQLMDVWHVDYWTNPDNWQWVRGAQVPIFDGVGWQDGLLSNGSTQWRISRTIDPNALGTPHGTIYGICAFPWFGAWGQAGFGSCQPDSQFFWLN